jgi:hypothetical protein
LKDALIEKPRPELDCLSWVCDWKYAYAVLKARIETVPDVRRRDAALERIAPLGKEPYEEDAVSAKDWRELAAESQRSAATYPEALAKLLMTISCGADGAPYVIGGMIRELDRRFRDNPAQKAEVARVFLDEWNCPGARGLSGENKAKLRQMRSPESPKLSPGTASQ